MELVALVLGFIGEHVLALSREAVHRSPDEERVEELADSAALKQGGPPPPVAGNCKRIR